MTDPIARLERNLTQQLLKAAAGRAIFCPTCSSVLDARTTVLVTTPKRSAISCGACFDSSIAQLVESTGLDQATVLDGVEVDDGRVVFARKAAAR